MRSLRTNRNDDDDEQKDGEWASDQDEDREFLGKKRERRKKEP